MLRHNKCALIFINWNPFYAFLRCSKMSYKTWGNKVSLFNIEGLSLMFFFMLFLCVPIVQKMVFTSVDRKYRNFVLLLFTLYALSRLRFKQYIDIVLWHCMLTTIPNKHKIRFLSASPSLCIFIFKLYLNKCKLI